MRGMVQIPRITMPELDLERRVGIEQVEWGPWSETLHGEEASE